MTSTVTVVLPIFALVLAGFLSRRLGVLGPDASGELNRFVVYLALPAVLLEVMAHATWSQLYQPGFVATFGVSRLRLCAHRGGAPAGGPAIG